MVYDPARHHRRSVRLKGYDYSQAGAYFVTILVKDRKRLLGEVVSGKVRLSRIGQIVADAWQWLEAQYPYVTLDEWVVMPDHLHGIIILDDLTLRKGGSRAALTAADAAPSSADAAPMSGDPILIGTNRRKPLGSLIGAFKTVSTKQVNRWRQTPGARLWHRDFYEHIVRDDQDLRRIRNYIAQNPPRWTASRKIGQ